MRFALGHLGSWALIVLPRPRGAQETPADYRTVASRFSLHVVETTGLSIARMDLGRIALDTNRFTAFVANNSGSPRILGLSLRAVPGLWVRANWQRGYTFDISAHSQRRIEAAYVFRRMTPEATLRVSFGTPRDEWGGIDVCQARAPGSLQQVGLDLQVSVDYEHDRLEGVARLTVGNAGRAPVRRVPLLLNRLMTVRKVFDAAGHELRYVARVARFEDDPKLQVEFAEVVLVRPLPLGSRTELIVHYDGNLVGYVETGSLYLRDHIDTTFTILRADAYAFPVIGWPSRKANRAVARSPFTFRARVTVPKGLVAVTGGQRVGERHSTGQVTWEYASTGTIPFLNIAIARYTEIGQHRIRAYVFPEDSAAALRVVAKAEQALDSLARWFGTLGEEPRVTLIEIPPGYGSQASLSAGIIQDASAFRDASRLHELYHELSHFWNPRDTATPSPRVTEGLATLLEQRLAGALDGWTGLDSLVEFRAARLRARAATDTALRVFPMRLYGEADRTGHSYSVGMLLFYSLQQCLGTPAFDALWGDYLRKTRRAGGSDRDFAAFAVERTGNPAVRELFDTWFFTTRWIERLSAGEPLVGLGAGCGRPR